MIWVEQKENSTWISGIRRAINKLNLSSTHPPEEEIGEEEC